MTGKLIVIEGLGGIGKTTQVRKLVASLLEDGRTVLSFREPGGTAFGEHIRSILMVPLARCRRAEIALFMAARAQLFHEHVRPTLEEGTHVVLDRFWPSTVAYQGEETVVEEVVSQTLSMIGTRGVGGWQLVVPDLTVYLWAPTNLIRARIEAAAEEEPHRFRREVLDNAEQITGRLEEALLWIERHGGRVARINAACNAGCVAADVLAATVEALDS